MFLLEDVNRARLEEACRRVREMDFLSYTEYAKLVLRKRAGFKKHLPSLQGNWAKLQQIDFWIHYPTSEHR